MNGIVGQANSYDVDSRHVANSLTNKIIPVSRSKQTKYRAQGGH